jgi:DNA-binding transcriptional regulator WhiA
MQYADYSLAQLAQVSVPAISKPGLSHRLKKIIELGEHILESKK